MTLKKLFHGLSGVTLIQGKPTTPVLSLSTDSRRVTPGSLFIALSGMRTHGNHYIEEAIDRGAVAIVTQEDVWIPPHIAQVAVAEPKAILSVIASRFLGHPEKALKLTGFLGTSGKTVASHLLRHFHQSAESPTGLVGTIHYAVGNRTLPAHRTTPEPVELYGLLAQMKEQACAHVFFEVSAHGIRQGRVNGLPFETLVLMNLTPEHLHYHGSFDRFVELEAAFIRSHEKPFKHLVAGIDDPEVRRLVSELPAHLKERMVTFGTSPEADFRAVDPVYTNKDTRFQLQWPDGEVRLVSPLPGAFNLQNTLAALACGHLQGLDFAFMGGRLLEFEGVRGRMERLEAGQEPTVLIDYMHTEAAYDKGLRMVRDLTPGRLITVFGCGGDRDPGVRPRITSVVSELSDLAIATADNPRSEEIPDIFEDMRRGNEAIGNLTFIRDRRAAIAAALKEARAGDTVLIAGKGHETFQDFGDRVIPFDDRAVARDIILNRDWLPS